MRMRILIMKYKNVTTKAYVFNSKAGFARDNSFNSFKFKKKYYPLRGYCL